MEKKTRQEELVVRETNRIKSEIHTLKDILKVKDSVGNGQLGSSQLDHGKRIRLLQGVNTLPAPLDRSLAWNKLRQPIVYSSNIVKRIENPTVRPKELSSFIPSRPIEVASNDLASEDELRSLIWSYIEDSLSSHPNPDIRVTKGLDSSKVPDFIQPFQKQLSKDFEKARRAFLYLKDMCQDLLTKAIISDTRQGQYLTQMFQLEHSMNKEEILREINKKLMSIATKGEQVLQQTKDLGFENVWIASTGLILNTQTGKYESLLTKRHAPNAFVIPQDPQCRMIFLADVFHTNPDLVADVSKKYELKKSEFEVVLHETTHLGSHTGDLMQFRIPPKGFSKSGRDVLQEYNEKFFSIKDTPAFENFVDRVAQYQNLPELSRDAVMAKVLLDDMLRVNLQMEDAEMVATIVRDLSQGRDFNVRPRVQRSISDKPDQKISKSLFLNLVMGFLFNTEQYWLSPHLDKTQEKEKIEVTQDPHVAATADIGDSTSNVKIEKRKAEKKSILNVVTMIKEKSDARKKTRRNQRLGIAQTETIYR
ncbi:MULTISPECIES: hypothetical protein [Enterococcus]|uniref:hypothetical protein n=1 Tax=Enterococcus TaxID=1350 RepID=UPI001CD6478B|nr:MULTISPECIES: hypothetical protein [Enterococcus]